MNHQMTDAQAAARMLELRAEWQRDAAADRDRWLPYVRSMLRTPAGELSADELQSVRAYALSAAIADGKFEADNCGGERMRAEAFMEWLRTSHRAEWGVVAQWIEEEFRDEQEVAGEPAWLDVDEVVLVADMLRAP